MKRGFLELYSPVELGAKVVGSDAEGESGPTQEARNLDAGIGLPCSELGLDFTKVLCFFPDLFFGSHTYLLM